ncbi:MAG: hypothetical protein KDB10_06000 [Acidimicrobiales bacterium]|nr:hypothetical protein [Acidimicrobiales bacterium]MCB9373419.1 hypothetical protein [Microthrixaceae bacterium]
MAPTAAFDLRRTADWLATQQLADLDRRHDELVTLVDAAAVAAGAPDALRPTATDPTPALVRLLNHHATTLHRRRVAA